MGSEMCIRDRYLGEGHAGGHSVHRPQCPLPRCPSPPYMAATPRGAYKTWSRKHVDGQMKKNVVGRAVCLVCDRGGALYKLSKWGLGQSPDRARF